MSNIAVVETRFCERVKGLEGRTINGWFDKVIKSESLIKRCMEQGAAKCLSVNEIFMSKVYIKSKSVAICT